MMRGFVKFVLRMLLRGLFRVRTSGLDRPVDTGKLLIIANHESLLDGLLLAVFLPFDPVFIVYTGLTRHFFFRLALKQVDYFSVDPASPMAVKHVIKIVESGRPVMIFPEGRITQTGSLMKIYDGPAFIAVKAGARILPIHLDGPAHSFFSHSAGKMPRHLFPRITISALATTVIAMPKEGSARQRRRSAGETMRKLMQTMQFEFRTKHTLYSALLAAMTTYGRGSTIVEDIKQAEYSYGNLLKMTLGLGRLVAKQSDENECVGILMPNLAATVCIVIGVGVHGRIPALINYKTGPAGIQDACTTAKIRTIFTSRAFIEQAKLDNDIAMIKNINILYLEDLQPCMNTGDKLWTLFGMLFPRVMQKSVNPENAAVVLFTSGSEGKPKGVVLSHRALLANIEQIRAIIDFSMEDKVMNALPIFHAFGLIGAILPIMTGMNLFLYPTPLHYRVIPEIIYDRRCSVMFGTSTFLAYYAKFAHPYDFYHLRYVVAGAEKLSSAVRDLWYEKFGIRILEGYGATETAPVLSVNTPMAYRSGTVGQLLPGIEHQIIPVQGIDNGGILHVRGPNMMSGYYLFDAPGTLQFPVSKMGEGWYETGDIATIDQDDFISIVGRVKRFVKIAGEMVSLEMVEKLAAHASPKSMHAASSQIDTLRGEALVLFTTDLTMTRDALLVSAKALGMTDISIPRKIQYVDTLPLLSTGKTDYVTLKRMAETV
ncbi:MAG: bifunctional acyl-ACP--phospholipid O-acyltransferase/long-chain-fatty-acid--ACP ligase [Betaproteobacteria bacterium]|nr:bifunctional acyl-ACP--phospholipid O-acyltransferase/long-chain-fatty-acid--ACP ligase [Betaproteobacteria bacterium]